MDFGTQRKVEVELDRLNLSRNPEVLGHVARAKEALKKRKWHDAEVALQAARASSSPKLTLKDLLVNCGEAISRSHANRLVASGGVLVDGKAAVSGSMDVSGAEQVTISGRVVATLAEIQER